MMPTQNKSLTLNADSSKARRTTEIFRAAYTKAGLSAASGQYLNENPEFMPELIKLLQRCAVPAPDNGHSMPVWIPIYKGLTVVEEVEIILVNFGQLEMRGSRESIAYYRAWGKQHGLRIVPNSRAYQLRSVRPKLHRDLGKNLAIVVIDMPYKDPADADDPNYPYCPYHIRYGDDGVWSDTFGGHIGPNIWFAFERE
jgi:hypothetical protein